MKRGQNSGQQLEKSPLQRQTIPKATTPQPLKAIHSSTSQTHQKPTTETPLRLTQQQATKHTTRQHSRSNMGSMPDQSTNMRSILLKFTTPRDLRQSSDIKETEELQQPMYQLTKPFHPKSAVNIMRNTNPYQDVQKGKKSYQRFLSSSSERSNRAQLLRSSQTSNSSLTERYTPPSGQQHLRPSPSRYLEESSKIETSQILRPKFGKPITNFVKSSENQENLCSVEKSNYGPTLHVRQSQNHKFIGTLREACF
ncbi:hypothetical protein FGO68_gene10937 [Halteria grandinella]|uniref:Uncharacterized protein n=1 Tax=Halteria grandinella TaxID=5974 RepID=A0A8J8SVF4_HALGN|nr:hypothetical protein FGO68_gene10937 [Halteria grandinella]